MMDALACLAGPQVNACLVDRIGADGVLMAMAGICAAVWIMVKLISPARPRGSDWNSGGTDCTVWGDGDGGGDCGGD